MAEDGLRERVGRYAAMQKSFYEDAAASDPLEVVGSYGFHEKFPYETYLLFEHGDVRRPIFPSFAGRRAFDIACGEGRMVRRMRSFFDEVDGADISATMVERARAQTPGSRFWVTDGVSAGEAPTAAYDFAYCTISLQHICVFTTRDLIIRDIRRILKPEGKATFQMLFSRDYPLLPNVPPTPVGDVGVQVYRQDTQHARWREDKTDALGTNSQCDVVIGTADLDAVRADFLEHFARVEVWLADISVGREWGPEHPARLPDDHPNCHLGAWYWGTHFIFIHCDGVKP